jgi:hypothetical protein
VPGTRPLCLLLAQPNRSHEQRLPLPTAGRQVKRTHTQSNNKRADRHGRPARCPDRPRRWTTPRAPIYTVLELPWHHTPIHQSTMAQRQPRMKILTVALCLAAVALASAGVVARQAEGETAPSAGPPAGRHGAGVPLLPPAGGGGHDDTGAGGALPSPAPAAASLPAAGHGGPVVPSPPAGRDATPARAGGGHLVILLPYA